MLDDLNCTLVRSRTGRYRNNQKRFDYSLLRSEKNEVSRLQHDSTIVHGMLRLLMPASTSSIPTLDKEWIIKSLLPKLNSALHADVLYY